MQFAQRFFKKDKLASGYSRKGSKRPPLNAFQWKYIVYLTTVITSAFIFVALPTWYFMNQNYQTFVKLAFDTAPDLIANLEREMLWLTSFFIVASIATVSFCIAICMRMTHLMNKPLQALDAHMRKLTNGDFAQAELSVNESDEFPGLTETYRFLYRTLQTHTVRELDLLEKLVIDPQNREALLIRNNLIKNKKAQLKILPSASTVEAPSKHHAA